MWLCTSLTLGRWRGDVLESHARAFELRESLLCIRVFQSVDTAPGFYDVLDDRHGLGHVVAARILVTVEDLRIF